MRKGFLLGLFFFLSSLALVAQTHQHGATSVGDGDYNPFVVAGKQRDFYLVYIRRKDGITDVMLRHSKDGVTFSVPVRVNDKAGDAAVRNENPPKIAIGPKGEVYVSWANERERWKGNIRFARSTDGGKTFSPALTLNSDADGAPLGHAFQSLAIGLKGRIYVAWIDERNKTKADRGAEIWLSTSEDGGKTFGQDRRILSDVCECCRTTLLANPEGKLWLSYRTVPRTGPMNRDILVAQSSDGGRSFVPHVVSQDGWELNGCPVAGPSLSLDQAGRVTVVWFLGGGERPGLYYATAEPQGQSFSPRRFLDPQQKMGKHAHAVPLPGGKMMVAWDEAAEQTTSACGVLDTKQGLVWKSNPRAGLAYPVVAVNDQIAVMAGMRLATHEIVTYVEKVNR